MSNDIKKRQKNLTELGAKSRAGTLMSSLFRAVASEVTELIQIKVPDRKDGKMQTRLVSKAEAIVRDVMQQALPCKGILDKDGILIVPDSKIQLECRKLIFDRVDGKTGTVGDVESSGDAIPDKISHINKNFLNIQAKKSGKKSSKPSEVKK